MKLESENIYMSNVNLTFKVTNFIREKGKWNIKSCHTDIKD